MATSTKRKRKAKTAPERTGQGIRFDFDFHGLRSAFVSVQDECTEDAGELIAAAIHHSWLQAAEEKS